MKDRKIRSPHISLVANKQRAVIEEAEAITAEYSIITYQEAMALEAHFLLPSEDR